MNQVVERDTQLAPQQPASEAAAVLAVISRAAADPNVDIAKLEKLLDMQERIMTKQAEMAFNRDMATMQAELPSITEKGEIIVDKKVRSRYARFEDINDTCKPVLQKHGFAVTFRTNTEGAVVKVTGILTHREGHSVNTDMTLPVDVSGSKNTVQAIGSSIAYGKRYVFCALLNITSRGEDDDGNGAGSGLPENTRVDFENALDAAVDAQGVENLWKQIVAACNQHKDKDAYATFKAKVTAKGKALKVKK